MKTVSEIPLSGVCVGCGACASMCKENAIKMEQISETGLFVPHVDPCVCTECRKCLTVCPGVNWANQTDSCQGDYGIGARANAYSAFASDYKLQQSAASGGVTTAFLCFLLQNGHIDGAVVSRRIKGNPLDSEAIIARTEETILSCKGSIYSPVCFVDVFEQLKKIPKDEQIAVVGLPCHIQALSLMMDRNHELEKKIFILISLVCGHFPNHLAYRYSFSHMGLNKFEKIHDIHNRGEGWPGFFRIESKRGILHRVPYGNDLSWGMVFSSPLFTPKACHVCPDPGGYAADIMVSDAWLPKFKENTVGVNLVLTKTLKGEQWIRKLQKSGDVQMKACSVDDFFKANERVFTAKIRNHKIAMKHLVGNKAKLLHRNIKDSGILIGPLVRIRLWCYYLHVKLSLFFHLDRAAGRLPKFFLIYWKVIGLLKR